MIRREVPGHRELLLIGVVRGLTREGEALPPALDSFAPSAVGVGLSREESQSLLDHFVRPSCEPFVPLLASENTEIRELGRFGEVRVPHPGLLAALEWAERRAVPLLPVDPTEERDAELFGEHVGYLELVRRTVRERGLLRSPPKVGSAEEFVLAWDARINGGAASRRLRRERDRLAAAEIARFAEAHGRVAAVVDLERVEGLSAALGAPAGR